MRTLLYLSEGCCARAHGFIVKLFLKQFGRNHVNCHFNVTAKRKFLLQMPIRRLRRVLHHDSTQMCMHKVRQLVDLEKLMIDNYQNYGFLNIMLVSCLPAA